MKKVLYFFLALIILIPTTANAQSCPFNVVFSVTDATCFNNGEVVYALVDENDVPYSSLPEGLSNVRIYFRTHESDSAQYSGHYYTGGYDTMLMNSGTFFVGVEGLCDDGAGGYIKVDTQTVLTINTTYTVPTASMIYATAHTATDFGTYPSLSCVNTGRAQLLIEGGRYPYSIDVVNDSSDTLKTVVFNEAMYSNTDRWRYDYMDYYTIDSLPPGEWDFYVDDGCQYGLPRTTQTIEVIPLPQLDKVGIYASSGNSSDSNVIKIRTTLDCPYQYYIQELTPYMTYRFTIDGESPQPWQQYPTTTTGTAILYDTVSSVQSYCELWDRDITFEFNINHPCGNESDTRVFQYHKPNDALFVSDVYTQMDSVVIQPNCTTTRYSHNDYYSISYNSYEYNHVNDDADHNEHRHHYTLPVTWIYTDVSSNTTIKTDSVYNIDNISVLTAAEAMAFYHEEMSFSKNISRKLVDAHGCILYDEQITMSFEKFTNEKSPSWQMSAVGEDHCCLEARSITITENNSPDIDYDGTTINLVTSPYNNLYNFTAVYHAAQQTWEVEKAQLTNTSSIMGNPNGKELVLSDYCLPSGPYRFEITTPCNTFVVEQELSFADIYTIEMSEEPTHTTDQSCTDMYVTYTTGSFTQISRNTDPSTGTPTADISSPLNALFKVVDGPAGGYSNDTYTLGQPIRLAHQGTYIVSIYPENSDLYCGFTPLYDTIEYGGGTIRFIYSACLMCDSNALTGKVYALAENGTTPYTYILYDDFDKNGNIIASNNTGYFIDVPLDVTQKYSCEVIDACGSYFHVNFYPKTLADLQKTWFDGGLVRTSTCEGSTIQIHALQIGSIFGYEWTGPDGFYSNSAEPTVFIPRGASNGWYKVDISQTGCAEHIYDSIYLEVLHSPTLQLASDATVCPGEEVTLTFTPTNSSGSGDFEFTIAFANENGIETHDFTSTVDVPVNYTYSTTTSAKIYPLSITEYDGCEYTSADATDTVRITVQSGTIDYCQTITTNDTVCYDGTGHLLAKSQLSAPYTINWYGDYNLTQLLKTEEITDDDTWSFYDTTELKTRTFLYAITEKDGYCPLVHGVHNHTMNMQDGQTTVNCNDAYRLYDSGGENGAYTSNEVLTHTFQSADNKQIAIHFDSLNLSQTSHLFIFTGHEQVSDSLLYHFASGSIPPDVVFSHSDELTILFVAGISPGVGWSALVYNNTELATAEVHSRNHVTLHDEVCQSQTNSYADLYHVVPDIVSAAEMDSIIKIAGNHIFENTLTGMDVNHCDSIVTFVLTVNAPPHRDTTVVTTTLENGGHYVWRGVERTETGLYTDIISTADGCDSVEVLNLIILEVDTSINEICLGDSTTMGVHVVTPEMPWNNPEVFHRRAVGDVLCTDGSILRPDTFLISGKTAMGVVFYLEENNVHGKAIALTDAYDGYCTWARQEVFDLVRSYYEASSTYQALFDMEGYANTLRIKETAEQALGYDFLLNAPAAYYCYYYDHLTQTTGYEHIGWYLPSSGELNLFYAYRNVVNASLKKLAGSPHNATLPLVWRNDGDDKYWTSTGKTDNRKAYRISSKGQVNGNDNKYEISQYPSRVRAIISF